MFTRRALSQGLVFGTVAALGAVAIASCTMDFKAFDFYGQPNGGSAATGGHGGTTTTSSHGGGGTGGGGTGGTATGGTGGTATGGTGGTATGGTGGTGGCSAPDECPGNDTTCRYRTCVGNQCGMADAPVATPCVEGGGTQCDGNGNCVQCGVPDNPPGGNCPSAICNGGCANNICHVTCPGAACGGAIDCPDGFACDVQCAAGNACKDQTVTCPTGNYACDVTCGSNGACPNTQLHCGTGPCTIHCNNTHACNGSTVNCGAEACTAECSGPQTFTVNHGTSCGCIKCNGACN
jgi:hypothetical protein